MSSDLALIKDKNIQTPEDLVFKALGDRRRRLILDLLKQAPMNTGAICDALPELDRCTVMQHLGVLERADLIFTKREGKCRINYLNVAPLIAIQERWLGGFKTSALKGLSNLAKL
ncbi:MAG TPA: helix-turn-helix transcriptional regulator [Fimbriimonas sp.]|nr:helix-turn-helix transcriptional regulator [Fimbriimonas sp.]